MSHTDIQKLPMFPRYTKSFVTHAHRSHTNSKVSIHCLLSESTKGRISAEHSDSFFIKSSFLIRVCLKRGPSPTLVFYIYPRKAHANLLGTPAETHKVMKAFPKRLGNADSVPVIIFKLFYIQAFSPTSLLNIWQI